MACASCSGVRFEKLPRMADFALWAMACETAFWPTGTFARSYDANRGVALENIRRRPGGRNIVSTVSSVWDEDLQFGPRGTRTFTL
jgi:hypothetical protein